MGPGPGQRWPITLAWAGLALVLAAGLALGAGLGPGAGRGPAPAAMAGSVPAWAGSAAAAARAGSAAAPASDTARIARLERLIGCPSCADLSVAESNAPSALAIRQLVDQQVMAGATDRAIEARVVASYGGSILLRPATSGIAGAVWVLPILGGAMALAGLAVMFGRRRGSPPVPTDDDVDLVARALAEQ